MYMVRESWTDERLDDFAKNVDRRFDKVDHELHRVNDRLDAMSRAMIQAMLMFTGSILVLASVILTH
jgi:hypothetical protein